MRKARENCHWFHLGMGGNRAKGIGRGCNCPDNIIRLSWHEHDILDGRDRDKRVDEARVTYRQELESLPASYHHKWAFAKVNGYLQQFYKAYLHYEQRCQGTSECSQKKVNMILPVIIAVMLIVARQAGAQSMVDINKIVMIESGGNAQAVNGKSGAVGLMQITSICLKEWNNHHPQEQYSRNDLFDPAVNTKIGSWYINDRIPEMIRSAKQDVTVEKCIIAYNAGISYVVGHRYWIGNKAYFRQVKDIPNETRRYIKKYNGGANG